MGDFNRKSGVADVLDGKPSCSEIEKLAAVRLVASKFHDDVEMFEYVCAVLGLDPQDGRR